MSATSTPNGHVMSMRTARSMAVEFVTDGHPDKICDQIADTILDAAISQDPLSRVAMEVTGGHGLVVVVGERTTKAKLDIVRIVQEKYRGIGHEHSIEVLLRVVKQSPHIKVGADKGGAGDQGIMVGYAIKGESNFMPRTWNLARALTQRLKEVRVKGILAYLKPDGKSQVTTVGDLVTHVTIAAHHSKGVKLERIRRDILEHVVHVVVPGIAAENVIVNGTGKFAKGGFEADAGTTGRKLMVDNYGPVVEVGGGCYSGKDPSKVDRSAAYFCRMIAKSIVAGGYADEAVVKVGYAIGVAEPTFRSVQVSLPEKKVATLEEKVLKLFDFRPNRFFFRNSLKVIHTHGLDTKNRNDKIKLC